MKSTLSSRKVASINAAVFFIFWLLVLLTGADKPPPPGFLWIILVVAVCAAVVYWRIPTYISWRRTQRPHRYWRVLLDGFVAGLVVALPFVLKGSGEPTVTMRTSDYVIWFVVVGVVGAVNSATLYFANTLVVRTIPTRNLNE